MSIAHRRKHVLVKEGLEKCFEESELELPHSECRTINQVVNENAARETGRWVSDRAACCAALTETLRSSEVLECQQTGSL